MKHTSLQQIIKDHVHLPSRTNGRGWHSVLCKVCNDHGRKGPRAGFLFDKENVTYHCFNCGHTSVFNPNEHKTIPQTMISVLEAFHVPDSEWQQVNFNQLSREGGQAGKKQKTNKILEPKEIKLPEWFTPLQDAQNDDEWALYAIEWLKDKRGINHKDYPFYISSTRFKDIPLSKKWYGRLIIPIYKDKKLVFYQGRDLSDTRPQKYLSIATDKQNVVYGYDFIKQQTDDPLYVVEGWFDAFHIKGVAILGREMTDGQIRWLNQSTRTKVIIPDRSGQGYELALQGLKQGWKISTPDFGDDIKDVNDAIVRYGLSYVLISINKNIKSGFNAETSLRVYCKK